MADVVPATRRTAVPIAVFDAPAIPHTHGATTGVPSTLVAAGAVLVGVSACMSTTLAYYATFSASLVCFARALSLERVDGFLGALDACARETAQLARAAAASAYADAETDLRRLMDAARGHPVLAPVVAAAEERARLARAAVVDAVGGLKRWAEARWSEHRDAAPAALFLLRLIAYVIYLGATVLISAVYEEARARTPAVLGYLRGVIKEVRWSPSRKKKAEEEAAAVPSGARFKDTLCLVGVVVYLLYGTDMLAHAYAISAITGLQFGAVCAVVMCGFALLVADLVCPPDDSDDETGTAGDDKLNTANTSRPAGNGGEARRTAELEVRDSWNYMWLLIIVAYFVDVCLLRVTVGPQPVAVAFLALCGIEILNVGKKVHNAPDDDGEGATDAVNAGLHKWRCAATAVVAASSAKVLAIGVLLDAQLAVLSFVSLCAMTALLLVREESLSDLDASGEDKDGEEEGAGIAGDDTGGDEEEDDEVRAEHSNRSAEDAEEGSVLEEHCDSSEKQVEEKRQEEPDYSSGSSMDGWDFVEVDPDMPIKDSGAAELSHGPTSSLRKQPCRRYSAPGPLRGTGHASPCWRPL